MSDTVDPFAYLSQTSVSRETAALIGAEDPEKDDPFAYLDPSAPRQYVFTREREEFGIGDAFKSGVKRGFLEPLTFLRGREEVAEEVDTKGETIAEVLGSMVGLGINFVPVSVGTGLAMRGVGLAAKMSPEVAQFVKYTLAGGIQFAGVSETKEEVPKNLAMGVAFGGAIEAFFLVRAMKGRTVNPGRLFDDGSPVPDVPIAPSTIAKEEALVPTEAKLPGQITQEVVDLADETLSYDQVLASMAREYHSTIRINGVEDLDSVIRIVNEKMPNAQATSRPVVGSNVHEVLIHNPVNRADRLSSKQLAQWRKNGVFEGMEIQYDGRSFAATGKVFDGNIQIRDPDPRRSAVAFAPKRKNVTIPVSPKVFTPTARKLALLRGLTEHTSARIGFTIPAAGSGAARRGIVDTREFLQAPSLEGFIKEHMDDILEVGGVDLQDATRKYAQMIGIRGLVEVEEGITKRVHVFDQDTVSFIRDVPRLGVDIDEATFVNLAGGKGTELESFVPSWKNSIAGPLREQGIAEKEIQELLELHRIEMNNTLENLMDPEFKAVVNASRVQFRGECG